jgi:hypothetical protein
MPAEYVPTDAHRALVESASAFGITQAEIATQLKISEPTLSKHFRDELDGGAFKALSSQSRVMTRPLRDRGDTCAYGPFSSSQDGPRSDLFERQGWLSAFFCSSCSFLTGKSAHAPPASS